MGGIGRAALEGVSPRSRGDLGGPRGDLGGLHGYLGRPRGDLGEHRGDPHPLLAVVSLLAFVGGVGKAKVGLWQTLKRYLALEQSLGMKPRLDGVSRLERDGETSAAGPSGQMSGERLPGWPGRGGGSRNRGRAWWGGSGCRRRR